MRKPNFKLIFLQLLGIIFLIYGTLRFFYSMYAEETFKLLNHKEKNNSFEVVDSIGQFFLNRFYFAFVISLLGISIISIINWKNKSNYINTIIVSISVFLVWFTGILFSNFINKYFNYFGGLVTKNYFYSFILGGIILTSISFILLRKSYKLEKKHSS